MKIVKLSNGKYAVRRGWIFREYLDLRVTKPYWWGLNDMFIGDCFADTAEEAKAKADNILVYEVAPSQMENE